MNKRYLLPLAVLVIALFGITCERTTTTNVSGGAVELTSIPLDYGELESVTTDAAYPDWAQLWFVDSLGAIRMARVNWSAKTMLKDVVVISRN